MADNITQRYKAIPDPTPDPASLLETIRAQKEVIEVLTRQRRPIGAAAVTWDDLVKLGLIAKSDVPLR